MGVRTNPRDTKAGAQPVFFAHRQGRSARRDAAQLPADSPTALPPRFLPTNQSAAAPVPPSEYARSLVVPVGAFAATAYLFGIVAALVATTAILTLAVAGGIWVLNNTPNF